MNIVQAGVLGVAGVLLAIQFKNGKTEYGMYISIALSLLIFLGIMGYMETILQMLRTIGSYIQIDTAYIGILLKMTGITYIAEFSSDICKDAGYQTIAGQIEIFGKLVILALSLPVLLAVLETVRGFLS